MRPPQERATSSGCGATKTWVMAGRVYRAVPAARAPRASRREAARADERHEDARPVRRLVPVIPAPRDEGQDLEVARPDRDDEATAVRQLVAQRRRDAWRGGGHDDPVPRRTAGVAETAVQGADLDAIAETEGIESPAGRV